MKKFFHFFLCASLILSLEDSRALAFWGKKKTVAPVAPQAKEKKFGPVRIFEQPDYMVLFSIYPITVKLTQEGPSQQDPKWSELGYKLVDRTGEPGKLFGESGWVEIRFQDKEGFNVMTEPVHFDNPKTEYYGFVRIENSKAGQISRIDLKPLKPSEIPKPASEPSPSPAPVNPPFAPLPSAAPLAQEEAPKPPPPAEPSEPLQAEPLPAPPSPASVVDPSAVPPAQVVPAEPKPIEINPVEEETLPVDTGGVITNAVIQKTLESLEKKSVDAGDAPKDNPK